MHADSVTLLINRLIWDILQNRGQIDVWILMLLIHFISDRFCWKLEWDLTDISCSDNSHCLTFSIMRVQTGIIELRPHLLYLNPLAVLHWRMPGARPSPHLGVQILSFWHTKFSKRNHLRSPPPYEVHAPPTTGNPGSATETFQHLPT